jgi:K+-transporting ATPase KdpF subunit
MSGWEIAGAVLAGGLLVYLVAVLLRPEDFS